MLNPFRRRTHVFEFTGVRDLRLICCTMFTMWLGILAAAVAPSSLLTLELRNLTVNRAALATGSEVRSSDG